MRVIAPVLLFASLSLAQVTGSVTGAVVNRVTGAGVPGVVVTVYTRQAVLYEATSDDSGSFRIFGMKPGDYEIRFEKEGFDSFPTKIPPQPYKVGQGQDPVRIRLELTPMVSFSGRVLDPEGNPISQGAVKLGNFKVPVSPDGSFIVKNLVPGSYDFAAIPNADRVPEGARAPVPTNAPEPVVIRGDMDVSGYEIRLHAAEVYRVSGVVLDETGNPKSKVPVQLLPRIQSGTRVLGGGDFITLIGPGPYVGPEEARVISAADGSFEFPAVRSGEWQLATSLAGQIDSATFINTFHNGAASVIVGNHAVENVQIRQWPTFKMSGTIDWGDATPNRRVGVSLRPADGRIGPGGVSTMDANGTLNYSAVTRGQSLILPQAGPGFYPVSAVLNGQEVLGKPVDLLPGSTFRVSFKAANGSVHGTVDNCNGAIVVLIPKEVQTIAFGRTAACRADGTFEMIGVAPGDYSAVAFHVSTSDRLSDPRLLARIVSSGTSISVAQSAVEVRLNVDPSLE